MNWKLHLTLGAASGIAGGICLLANPLGAVEYTVTCAISSLICDLDTPTSKIGRMSPTISKICNKMFGHRGFLHTPCFLALCWLCYFNINKGIYIDNTFWIMFGFSIGFLCHILQDILTKGGIMLLYPFCKKKFHLTNFKSKSKIHILFTIPMVISAIYVMPTIITYTMYIFER